MSSLRRKRQMGGSKRTSISRSPEAHKSLRIEALRRDMTMSQLIAHAQTDAGVDIPAEDLEE